MSIQQPLSPPVDTLQSALICLMSRYNMTMSQASEDCPERLALMVLQHLEWLLAHPDLDSEVLRSTYRNLMIDWRVLLKWHQQQSIVWEDTQPQANLRVH